MFVVSSGIFYSWGPTDIEINQALVEFNPAWSGFTQFVTWKSEPAKIGEIIEEASLFQETFALNPAVTLVSLGVSLDWQLPADGDLYSQAISTGKSLVFLWNEWSQPDNENIRLLYPQLVDDGATYALFLFFDQGLGKLEAWCDAYREIFKTSPLD